MCLTRVDKKPKRTPGTGYKIVRKFDGKYLSWDYIPNAGKVVYPPNRWIEDTNIETIGFPDNQYPAGIHVSDNLNGCREAIARCISNEPSLVIIQCKYRKVVASGEDIGYGNVFVARQVINKGEVELDKIIKEG